MTPNDTTDDTTRLARRWFNDLFNRGELDTADEVLADDVGYDGPQSPAPAT